MTAGNPATQLMNDILVAVSRLPGSLCWRANSGMAVTRTRQIVRMNIPGCGDIIGAIKGKPVSIEVKFGTGRQSPQQRAFQTAWERAGGIYIVGRSVEQVLADLEAAI
jgi:hypothetical protein